MRITLVGISFFAIRIPPFFPPFSGKRVEILGHTIHNTLNRLTRLGSGDSDEVNIRPTLQFGVANGPLLVFLDSFLERGFRSLLLKQSIAASRACINQKHEFVCCCESQGQSCTFKEGYAIKLNLPSLMFVFRFPI